MSRLPVVADDAGAWGTILNEYLTEHVVPTGGMLEYAGAAAPTGFLLCDGTSYLRADYNALFTALGGTNSPWGLPDGTHFNVPDMRGRMAVGLGTHTDVDTLAESDGTAVGDRRPKHYHTVNESAHSHSGNSVTTFEDNFGSAGWQGTAGVTGTLPTEGATTGLTVGPQTNSPADGPAYVVVNYIIKT